MYVSIDLKLLATLASSPEIGMKAIFTQYQEQVFRWSLQIVKEQSLAEDVVQEVFMEIWKRRSATDNIGSLGAYLRRAAINRSLNALKKHRPTSETDDTIQDNAVSISAGLEAAEMQEKIDQLIDALPERCRLTFVLSRFHDMTYREIAQELDVSEKTVENQISKAMKLLREGLKDYL